MTDPADGMKGLKILVVEDDYLIADELCASLEDFGAEVLGPAPSVSAALAIVHSGREIDGATLDVSLGREKAFGIAAALRDRGIPFVFVTGYDDEIIPDEFSGFPRCRKPASLKQLIAALLAISAGASVRTRT